MGVRCVVWRRRCSSFLPQTVAVKRPDNDASPVMFRDNATKAEEKAANEAASEDDRPRPPVNRAGVEPSTKLVTQLRRYDR